MPAAVSWTLLVPPPLPTTLPAPAGGASPKLPCPIDPYSQNDLLGLFDRLLPPHYIAPLKSPGPGYELLQMTAQVGARLSEAVERFACAAFILSASGGSFATGTVQLFRQAAIPDGVTTVVVKAGTVVTSSLGGRSFITTADVTFAPSALGPFDVPVISVAMGYEYNETGTKTAADGASLPGEVDTIVTLVEDPAYGDPTILVTQGADITGGVDASLDQQGLDRGLGRFGSESDTAYAARIRTLPDTISPDAVDRAMELLFVPYNATFTFIETWDIGYQTCWDGPGGPIAGSSYDSNLFCFDDPRPAIPFRNRWLNETDFRGGFIVVVPNLAAIQDVGMAYDDTATGPNSLQTPIGKRAVGAYDVPSTLIASELQGGYDGFDVVKQVVYKSVWTSLQNIKAAGVTAAVELAGQ